MNLLITTGIFPPDIGGPATYIDTLARHLVLNGTKVHVLTYSSSIRSNKSPSLPFDVTRVWGGWPIWIKHAIFGLKLLYLLQNYDMVFALNVWSAGFPSFIASRILKKKFILRIVGDYAWEVGVGKNKVNLLIDDFQNVSKKGWIRRLHFFQAKICRKADKIIVPSKYLAIMVENWGVPKEKINIVYNGIEAVKSNLTKEEARKKIGIPGSIILSSGRLVPWKGFKMLIKIMPRLLEINQFFRLVIIGDGPEKNMLGQMVKNMGLQNKVYLVGNKSKNDSAVYMAAADMFVLNSGYEGFSHALIEAMTYGVPVIASAMGGNKELIKQGENGFLVKYNDEFNLVEAIKGLWQHDELRSIFIKEGLKTVNKFSSERMIKETVKILES